MKRNKTVAWEIYLNGKNIETIFTSVYCSIDEVYHGLVNHDGFHPNIKLKRIVF